MTSAPKSARNAVPHGKTCTCSRDNTRIPLRIACCTMMGLHLLCQRGLPPPGLDLLQHDWWQWKEPTAVVDNIAGECRWNCHNDLCFNREAPIETAQGTACMDTGKAAWVEAVLGIITPRATKYGVPP